MYGFFSRLVVLEPVKEMRGVGDLGSVDWEAAEERWRCVWAVLLP
ncbi:Protein of unknown function (plasmid) [Magnetospira sp. QH-2]|nr:Protein of unknown function [Magnetospira sp. QH-2]